MISSLFIDRPRLSVVMAIVITLGGLLALTRIPVAQLPDIVPPQVEVTTIYPGASAEVLEATVAQPLEAKIVGVDKMIYMKSTSGNDGSYTLTVSFELGTNPDINTVNVLNRVQTANAELPATVQAEGLTVQKRSSAILMFVNFYSPNAKFDPLFPAPLPHHQRDQPTEQGHHDHAIDGRQVAQPGGGIPQCVQPDRPEVAGDNVADAVHQHPAGQVAPAGYQPYRDAGQRGEHRVREW